MPEVTRCRCYRQLAAGELWKAHSPKPSVCRHFGESPFLQKGSALTSFPSALPHPVLPIMKLHGLAWLSLLF